MKNKSDKKVLLSGSLVAGAILSLATLANAKPVSYTNLGSGAAVRSTLTGTTTNAAGLELNCGAKKDSVHKAKEGKCGQGKCGEGKCGGKKGGKGKGKGMAKDSTKTKSGK
ncbi:hypothetical protein [Chitinophaga sp. Cy-1792]|uniref:HvfA family oxazolone/thioamide-modified RiPP metallophore n=1 Tax=Chitinophaga sp. Cy-1792 TaxID=2608339 RepID=UPI0014235DCB|nr:hypothetical protein [Chitinophaga sp. Cy-1792]NIG53793.1 hypothetical protein [Chitinophaga sp. Cy-1792]